MTPEFFIHLYNHLPNIYPSDDNSGYYVNPYSFSGYDVPYTWNVNVPTLLKNVALKISKITGITYEDTETTGADDNDHFFNWAGTQVRVSKNDIGFLEALWKLNPAAKIEAMKLSNAQVEQFLIDSKQMLLKFVKTKVKKTWYFRETGEMVKLDSDLDEDGLTLERIAKLIKSKNINRKELEYFLNIFNELKGGDEA